MDARCVNIETLCKPASAYPLGIIFNKLRSEPPAHLRQAVAAARANAASIARERARPRMSVMLSAWAQDAEALARAPSREHFVRLAEPGEAYAPIAAMCVRRARHLGAGAFEALALPLSLKAMPALADDVGEEVAAECFRRAKRSQRLERRALIKMEQGQPRIMGMRIERWEAEPDPVDVVRHWSRPNGPRDRVDPAWLERAALTASGVAQ